MENNTVEQDLVYYNEKKKIKWIIMGLVALALIVLAFGAYIYTKYQKGSISTVEGCLPGDRFSSKTGEPCFDPGLQSCPEGEFYDQVTGEPCVGAVDPEATPETGAKDYNARLEEYAGKSLLFDASCTTVAGKLTVLSGTQVLLVNNSQTVLELGVPGRTSIVPPYHYAVTSEFIAPGEFPVTCNRETKATIVVK